LLTLKAFSNKAKDIRGTVTVISADPGMAAIQLVTSRLWVRCHNHYTTKPHRLERTEPNWCT